MLAEQLPGILITVNEAVVLQAVEEFLNRHMFKEPLKVTHIGGRTSLFDHNNQLYQGYLITCASELQRLAGETVH